MRRVAAVLAMLAGCGFDPSEVRDHAEADATARAPDGAVGLDGSAPALDAPDSSAPPPDGAALPDAPPAAPDARGNGVACLTTSNTCSPSQICCVENSGSCSYSAACAEPGSCGGDGMVCDGPEDCPPGSLCCSQLGGGWFDSYCATSCGSDWRICHGSGDCGGSSCCFSCGVSVGLCGVGC